MLRKFIVLWVALMALTVLTHSALGAKILLRIRAGNPADETKQVAIKSNLPAGVGTNAIISLDGLDLGYDVQNDIYFVQGNIELGPKETRVFDVEIDDVWTIPDEKLDQYREQAGKLLSMLDETPYLDNGKRLADEISKNLESIAESQAKSAIGAGVKPIAHIRAYEADSRVLDQVSRDVARLENLVLASGKDPGGLIGEVNTPPKTRPVLAPEDEDVKTAVIRITVRNTSPNETRRVDVKRELPPEIRPYDVLNSGDLEVATDPKTQLAYVYKNDVEVGPGESVGYEVIIRDKWNINQARISALLEAVSNIRSSLADKESYASVEQALEKIEKSLNAVAAEEGPSQLNAEYVAFYRNQATQLDMIERKITRLESALRPISKTTKLGFKAKPPSMRTTWLIIYIILGFLALMSLLFFLRWFGKSKSEKM